MAKFGKQSLENLAQCDERLQLIAAQLIEEMDVKVICGHRNKADQNRAYDTGKSRVRWPNGKHNKKPSLAMDVVPWPLDWNDIKRFHEMCKRVERIAKELGIKIRLGRDFKGLVDMPHIELV